MGASQDAAAALQVEETILAHHRLPAPFDVVIVARHAETGAVVHAGDPIFTLIDSATFWIQAHIDEERASQPALARPGTIARIGLEGDRVNEERVVRLTSARDGRLVDS